MTQTPLTRDAQLGRERERWGSTLSFRAANDGLNGRPGLAGARASIIRARARDARNSAAVVSENPHLLNVTRLSHTRYLLLCVKASREHAAATPMHKPWATGAKTFDNPLFSTAPRRPVDSVFGGHRGRSSQISRILIFSINSIHIAVRLSYPWRGGEFNSRQVFHPRAALRKSHPPDSSGEPAVAASTRCAGVAALGSRGCAVSQSLVCRCHGDDIGAHSRTKRTPFAAMPVLRSGALAGAPLGRMATTEMAGLVSRMKPALTGEGTR